MAKIKKSKRLIELEDALNKKEDKKQSSSTSSTSKGTANSGKSTGKSKSIIELEKKLYEKTIDFDTFETDLASMGTTIKNVYKGWQAPDTMKKTRSSLESMQKRIKAYQEYQKLYGGADLSEIANSYQAVLDDWDDRTKLYGEFENAKAFDTAKKNYEYSQKYDGYTYEEIQDAKKKIAPPDGPWSDLSNIATNKAIDGVKSTTSLKDKNANKSGFRDILEGKSKTIPEIDITKAREFAKSTLPSDEWKFLANYTGYSTLEDFDKALEGVDPNSDYAMKLRQGKNTIKSWEMETPTDKNHPNYDKDFESASKYVEPGYFELWGHNNARDIYIYINQDEDGRVRMLNGDQGDMLYVDADKMTSQQIKTYNYYYNKHGKDKALEYYNAIVEGLAQKTAESRMEMYQGNVPLELLFSIESGTNQFVTGARNNFNDEEYIPYNSTQIMTGMVREDLADDGFKIGDNSLGQVVFDVGTTASNMAIPIVASTAVSAIPVVGPSLGKAVGAGLMGASARGNSYQEKLNEGWTKESASTYGNLVGTSETAMNLVLSGVGKLGGKVTNKSIKAIANGIDNAYGRYFATMGIKGGSEFIEESFQTIAEPFFENLALGYAKNDWSDVDLEQAAYDGMLGFLSAGILEGPSTAVNVFGENRTAKNVAPTIRENGGVQKLLDIASLTPKESDAYNLYTQYAKKGINAENISDRQLGRLWVNSQRATQEVLGSKKTSFEDAQKATHTSVDLDHMAKDNRIERRATELSTETDSKKPLEEGVAIKGIKLGEDTKIVTDKGEVSVSEVALPDRHAHLVAFAEQMPESEANLFIAQYDGTTNVERYTDSFNLAVAYSKNAMPQETILENKGVLTENQVAEIYKATRTAVVQENQKAIENITQKHSKGTFLKGTFDDSVIDYKSATTDGSKVNWNSLTSRQRSAIKFAKMFSKATGVNIRFIQSAVKDGKRVGKNGSYDPNTNTIEIDVYAGIDGGYVTDAIIPTLSHEVTHWAKAKSPAIYESIKNELVPFLAKKEGKTVDGLVAEEMARMKAKHPDMNVTPESAMDELVARACEDMLTNSNQAKSLLAKMTYEERNNFVGKIQKTLKNLIEWVDELLSHYKSESEEAKLLRQYRAELKKVSKMWDEMLVSAIEANQALQKEGVTGEALAKEDADVQYSIRMIIGESGTNYGIGVYLDSDLLTGLTEAERKEMVKEYVVSELAGEHFIAYDNSNNAVDVRLATKSETFKNEKGKKKNVLKEIYNKYNKFVVKQEAIVLIDELIASANFNGAFPARHKHDWLDNNGKNDWDSWSVYIQEKNKSVWEATLNIANTTNGEKILYDIDPIKMVEQARKSAKSTTKTIVPQNGTKSQEQNSDRDSSGNTLTKEQAEYFKDSKVRDENGNLLVMYRGDTNEFTVFDRKKSKYSNLYGRGFYFTKNKAHAEQYGESREFYLDIKNPLSPKQNNITEEQMLKFLKAIENDGEDYDLYNYGEGATAESVLSLVWGKGDFEMLQDVNAGAIGDLVSAVELFNEVNGTEYDGIILPTETVTFNSEQAKLTSNKAPTENEDIRFSMRENVEETKELVAVHNMRVSELERTLDLGGLPMPSIAIIKAKRGHSEYGDVSLVFPKSTIDPKASRNNKVYGGDAWTPTYPTIEYKPNAKIAKKISDKYYELSRKIGYDESRPLYSYVYDLEEQLNRNKGEASLLEELYDDQNMMQLYLLDNGKGKVETIQKEIRTELTDAEVEMHEFFIKELGADVVDAIVWDGNGTPMSYRKNYLSKHEDAIRDAYKKLLTDVYHFTEDQVQTVLDSTKSADIVRFMREANKYRQNGRVTTKTEADYEATKQAIKEASGDGYRAWVDSLFKGIEEKSGIRNNADPFTYSGNRRSWEALHWENNLENVVKVMKAQDNGQTFFGGQAIWSVASKDFSSVDEIKADSNRLMTMDEEQYESIKNALGDRFSEIANSIMDKTESNYFIALDNAMECIVDAIRHSKTKSGILNYLKQFKQLTVTETNVEDIVALVTDISNMPTEYFEAKPKRAVELNEIATAIIPDSTSETTKARLNDIGIKFVEYESGNEDSRLKALNSLEDVKFSDRDSAYMDAVNSGDMQTAQKMVDEFAENKFHNSKVRDANGKLLKVFHGTTNEFTVFDRQFANIEGDFGKGYYFTSNEYDVEANYANEDGPDLTNKIAHYAEQLEYDDEYADLSYGEREEIAKQKFITSEPNTITAYLNMENPVYITPDEQGTFLDYTENYDEETDEFGEPEGLLLDFIEALKYNSYDYAYNDVDFSFLYEYAYDNGGVYASDAVKTIKHRIIDELADENGDLAINEVIRLAFEQIGFDGIIDTSVYYKFRNMNGMDSGTTHYIVFDSNQIKSAEPVTYDNDGNAIPLSQRFDDSNDDIRYSDRDSEGKALTKAQQEFFKDSKVRDADGNLKVMWHGTSANFTVFDIGRAGRNWGGDSRLGKGFYFADTKEEAQEWGKTSKTIKAYLNLKNPLDYTKPTPKNIAEEIDKYIEKSIAEFNEKEAWVTKEQYAENSKRSREIYMKDASLFVDLFKYDDNGRMTDGIREFLSGLGYDGIIAKNEVVAFYPEQIKLTTNKKPTTNEDMRFSDRITETVYDKMGEAKRLEKENARIKKDLANLKERLSIEGKVTGGTAVLSKDTDVIARHIDKIADSTFDTDKLSAELKDFYTYVRESSLKGTWNDDAVFAKAYELAEGVLTEAKPKTTPNDYAKHLLREIRSKRIRLSEPQKQEAKSAFGKNWNRAFFGKVVITDNGISLDSQWQEWASEYPDFFKEDVREGDQITALYEIYDDLKDVSEIVQEYDAEEQTRWLAEEIINKCWTLPVHFTIADKYDSQIKALNFEHRQAMKEMREDYEQRQKEQHKADKARYKELVTKVRDRKDTEIAKAKELGKERLNEYKENAERKTVMQSILATTTSLNKKLITNSKESHIPEALKPIVINLINAIDFSSKQLLGMKHTNKKFRGMPTKTDMELEKTFSKAKAMADGNVSLKDAVREVQKMFEDAERVATDTTDGTVDMSLIALDVNLKDEIGSLITEIDILEKSIGSEFVLQQMNLEQLNVLKAMVNSINHWATNVDKALAIKHKEGISNLSMQTIEENDVLGERKEYIGAIESLKDFFSWSNLLPANAFKRMGNGAVKVFNSLQDAQDTLAFHEEEITGFTEKLFKGKKIQDWRKEVKEFTLKLPNGKTKTVRMPVSYVMSLYCVAKQEDAQRHLFGLDENGNRYNGGGGGMTIKGFKEKVHVSKDTKNTILNEQLVKQITSVLTEEQRYVADKLQEFMNTTGSEWCDVVSMALYGIKKFGIKDYFPITVTPTTIKTLKPQDKRQSVHFFSILNYGFTKSRNPKANQSIEIGDIFEIFANHMSMMSIYSAYALPIYDMVRWYNFTSKNEDGEEIGVQKSLITAFGDSATTYVSRLISDLNGQHESSRLGFISRIFKNTKVAMVGNSLSVALLQPTAYLKAMVKIPTRYLLKSALYIKDFGASKGVKKAKQYCGIALWKSQGNFETDISQNMSTKILHDETKRQKLIEWSLKGAEWMDERTWGVLWNACEFEVRATRKDLKVGSEEFYETVGKKLRDVIYETQVVDSPLTRSDLMRSPDTGAKMITMFASEITVAYNMVHEAIVDAKLDVQRNGKEGAWKRNTKKIVMTLTAYTLTSAVSQIVATAVQAFRSDDDEEKEFEDYLKMYFSNFLLDWALIGKIPYIKETLSFAQGYSSSRVDTLWLESASKAIMYWTKAFEGKEGASKKALDNTLKSLSYLSGLPAYNQYRDLMATLDKLGILDAEDFKEMLDEIFE